MWLASSKKDAAREEGGARVVRGVGLREGLSGCSLSVKSEIIQLHQKGEKKGGGEFDCHQLVRPSARQSPHTHTNADRRACWKGLL